MKKLIIAVSTILFSFSANAAEQASLVVGAGLSDFTGANNTSMFFATKVADNLAARLNVVQANFGATTVAPTGAVPTAGQPAKLSNDTKVSIDALHFWRTAPRASVYAGGGVNIKNYRTGSLTGGIVYYATNRISISTEMNMQIGDNRRGVALSEGEAFAKQAKASADSNGQPTLYAASNGNIGMSVMLSYAF